MLLSRAEVIGHEKKSTKTQKADKTHEQKSVSMLDPLEM